MKWHMYVIRPHVGVRFCTCSGTPELTSCPWFISVLHQSWLMCCEEVVRAAAVRWERSFSRKEFGFVT